MPLKEPPFLTVPLLPDRISKYVHRRCGTGSPTYDNFDAEDCPGWLKYSFVVVVRDNHVVRRGA